MPKRVLIVGLRGDMHVERVAKLVRLIGGLPILADLSVDKVALSVVGGVRSGYVTCNATNERISFDSVHSVWSRFKRQCDESSDDAAIRAEMRFAWSEWTDVRASLSTYLAPGRWMNEFAVSEMMSRKGAQHVLASRVGLRVPDTSITNDADAVARLFERHSRVIYKPNRMPTLTRGRVVFATEVKLESIRRHREEIAAAPGIFQELIEREHELRVTIVGEQVFAVRIVVPNGRGGAIDRRQIPQGAMRYEVVTLDQALTRQLLEFHSRAKLVFGAYDLVISRSGEPIFLEVNPAGEWLELETRLEIPIAKAVAEQLMEGFT